MSRSNLPSVPPLLLLMLVVALIALIFVSAVTSFQPAPPIFSPSRRHPQSATAKSFPTRETTTTFRSKSSPSSSCSSTAILAATVYDQCDVAIVGGGFGGLYTALALDRMLQKSPRDLLRKLDIALIDPSDDFVFLPLLYDLTMGTASTREVCPSYEELLEGTNIRHVKASLDGILDTTASDDGSNRIGTIGSGGLPCRTLQLSSSNKGSQDTIRLSFDKAAVLSVGATPQSILEKVKGATDFTQPFYTQTDAVDTRDALFRLEQKIRRRKAAAKPTTEVAKPKVAIVGGGYGGVELAACVARRLGTDANVSLLTRGPPMKGTRAESLVEQALNTLNVNIELCSVDAIEPVPSQQVTTTTTTTTTMSSGKKQYCDPVRIRRSALDGKEIDVSNDEQWDIVFWTAGSMAADPVPNGMAELSMTASGRLAVNDKLQCKWNITSLPDVVLPARLPPIFALGDCADIVPTPQPNVPKTAQAAIQQADIVAFNILATLQNQPARLFTFQDLGTVLNLGGPNGAVLGPQEDAQLSSVLIPLLDTARAGLNVADTVFDAILNAPTTNPTSREVVERLGLSLGGYGLGVEDSKSGTLSGTLSGISRRAIYSVRMPTNKQRAYAAASSFVSSISALAKEASDQYQRVADEEKNR